MSRLMLMNLVEARNLSTNLFTFSDILSATTTDLIVGQDSTSELRQRDSNSGKNSARILRHVAHCTNVWQNIPKA